MKLVLLFLIMGLNFQFKRDKMFIKHSDGKIASIISSDDLTEEQKKELDKRAQEQHQKKESSSDGIKKPRSN